MKDIPFILLFCITILFGLIQHYRFGKIINERDAISMENEMLQIALASCHTDLTNAVFGLNRQLAELYPMMVYGTNVLRK